MKIIIKTLQIKLKKIFGSLNYEFNTPCLQEKIKKVIE